MADGEHVKTSTETLADEVSAALSEAANEMILEKIQNGKLAEDLIESIRQNPGRSPQTVVRDLAKDYTREALTRARDKLVEKGLGHLTDDPAVNDFYVHMIFDVVMPVLSGDVFGIAQKVWESGALQDIWEDWGNLRENLEEILKPNNPYQDAMSYIEIFSAAEKENTGALTPKLEDMLSDGGPRNGGAGGAPGGSTGGRSGGDTGGSKGGSTGGGSGPADLGVARTDVSEFGGGDPGSTGGGTGPSGGGQEDGGDGADDAGGPGGNGDDGTAAPGAPPSDGGGDDGEEGGGSDGFSAGWVLLQGSQPLPNRDDSDGDTEHDWSAPIWYNTDTGETHEGDEPPADEPADNADADADADAAPPNEDVHPEGYTPSDGGILPEVDPAVVAAWFQYKSDSLILTTGEELRRPSAEAVEAFGEAALQTLFDMVSRPTGEGEDQSGDPDDHHNPLEGLLPPEEPEAEFLGFLGPVRPLEDDGDPLAQIVAPDEI